MDRRIRRECPICGGPAGARAFPYATRANNLTFDYLQCRSCASVFVDPIPDKDTFAKMFSKASYHDAHYINCDSRHYENTAKLPRHFLRAGTSVADYNASPVFWAARLLGAVKRLLKPHFVGSSPPTHLLRVSEAPQLAFFTRVEPTLSLLHWDVQETGWPYASGGTLKRAIAGAASSLGDKSIGGATFGNRFRGAFRLPATARP